MTINEMDIRQMWAAMEIYGRNVLGGDYMMKYTPNEVYERLLGTEMEFDFLNGKCYQAEELHTIYELMEVATLEAMSKAFEGITYKYGEDVSYKAYLEKQERTSCEDIFNDSGEMVELY